MGFMTPALDKIFIGYDTPSGIDADHDSPRAFLIVSQDGAIERGWTRLTFVLRSPSTGRSAPLMLAFPAVRRLS